jgi:hypothetical protein
METRDSGVARRTNGRNSESLTRSKEAYQAETTGSLKHADDLYRRKGIREAMRKEDFCISSYF